VTPSTTRRPARWGSALDAITEATKQPEPWLQSFYFGNGTPGLRPSVQHALDDADPEAINAVPVGLDETAKPIEVRNGKFGPFVKRGDVTASLPPDLPLDELTIEKAV